MTEVVVCCGVGGTGKTTCAAALGVGYALAGRRVVVLTIDPARRLADAMGLELLGNTPHPVPLPPDAGATGVAPGRLDALMLDRKGTWDEVIRRFSPNAEAAERLLANRYYRAVSTRLTGSHEYMAIEKLHELVELGAWDLVVVDTPPAQHVLDFFRAPERIERVFDRRVLATLTEPGRGLVGAASRRAVALLRRLAGDRVMEDIAEFFQLVAGLSGGMRARSKAVSDLLHSDRTRYLLVTNAHAPDRNDLLGFLETLRERRMRFDGFLINRVAQRPPLDEGALDPRNLPPQPTGLPAAPWREVIAAMIALAAEAAETAAVHRAAAEALVAAAGDAPAWLLPEMPEGVRNIEGLASLASHLPPRSEPAIRGDR